MAEIETWDELSAEIMRLYEAKRYADADALLVANGGQFPDRQASILYTRLCFAALLGETQRALALLEEAVAQGYWFRSTQLREDPDLASLQGNPKFERLAALSFAREEEAQADAEPIMAVAQPSRGAPPYPTLIALHGNNTSTELTLPFWKSAAGSGFLTAIPQSTQAGGVNKFVWDDAGQAEQDIKGYFETLKHEHPVDAGRVSLGGFSMGGRVACWLALTRKIPVRGFIGVGPWLKGFEAWEPQFAAAAKAGLRGYLIVGDRDPGCYEGTLALHQMLEAYGVPCRLKVYPGLRHVYPPDFDAALAEALEFIFE